MSNMNKRLYGSGGYDGYDSYEPQDNIDNKKKDGADVVVKIECPDCCCKKDDKGWDKKEKNDKFDKCDKKEKNDKFCCPIDVALNAATGGCLLSGNFYAEYK